MLLKLPTILAHLQTLIFGYNIFYFARQFKTLYIIYQLLAYIKGNIQVKKKH